VNLASSCYELVQTALIAARNTQTEMIRLQANHFDRMAVNDAIGHLELALEELSCFCQKTPKAPWDARRGRQGSRIIEINGPPDCTTTP